MFAVYIVLLARVSQSQFPTESLKRANCSTCSLCRATVITLLLPQASPFKDLQRLHVRLSLHILHFVTELPVHSLTLHSRQSTITAAPPRHAPQHKAGRRSRGLSALWSGLLDALAAL